MGNKWSPADPADLKLYEPQEVFEAGLRNHHISNTSYPIAHTAVWKPYKIPCAEYELSVLEAFRGIDQLCLYSHIPFCETRCYYCEYTVVGKDELDETERYMQYLNRELGVYRNLLSTNRLTLHGFDIGGGTPSFVASELIAEHVSQVRSAFRFAPQTGISIETTPKIAAAEPHKLEQYIRCGIERISMGVQVTQPDLLKVLNRSDNGIEHHFKAVENIRAAGFKKFNIDLMYGFADQTLESWRATLEHTLALDPEYVTLYRMRYKLTRISEQASRVKTENVLAQARLAKQMLHDAGYAANPGKNTFSKIPGDIGTSDYLTRRVIDGMPYLGIGLGAQTFTHTTISYNDGSAGKNLNPYFRSLDAGRLPLQDFYRLPQQHMMAKMCAVSFYFGEIDLEAFQDKFGVSLESAFAKEVDFVLSQDLMQYTGGANPARRVVSGKPALSLTVKGAENFSGVIALFFAPSVKNYLISRHPDSAQDMNRNRKIALQVAGAESTL